MLLMGASSVPFRLDFFSDLANNEASRKSEKVVRFRIELFAEGLWRKRSNQEVGKAVCLSQNGRKFAKFIQ